ncbi:Kinesin motor domain containing protein [Tritrichomonas foetus]|uniref:Kinesin-like protein n=1 Tax=Tritrichomonas foetus TaxID=1144522 RepID=A0A1J4L0N3_9EUKA|nr:Kinesin motor domain containing protein [Tritrichomonas foetus]|eukprot:OHT16970.1 Kinesin motor domain containing protein [Tritrichomonas foetus]
MEDVCDLLGDTSKKLHVRQLDTGITVVGLSSHIVKNPQEITDLLMKGAKNRTTGATAMNATSSRSHSVFTIIIEQQEEDGRTRMGKLNLVDLAGSERLGKTEATGQRAKEGAKINQSLLALGNVISALVTGSKHVAYRDSKLTQLLQDSLGGNAKTCMVATLGPANYNYDETLSTLLYATRARDIKNIPKINEDPKDALLGQLKAQIDALKKQLEEQNASAGGDVNVEDNTYLKQIEDKHKSQIKALMAEKNMNEEQRKKMREKLEAEYEKQKKTKEESDQLKAKIQQMEQSVLVGGVNLVDKAKQQEEEIRAHESKMRRQQEEQKALALKKKQEEEQILLAEKKYGSIKEELVGKVHKIKKIRPLIKKMEESIDDIQQQFEREKNEQVSQIRNLSRELLLLQMIASSFIPDDHIANIERHCKYDEVNQKTIIDKVELAGCHQTVEEELPEINSVYINGIDDAIFGGTSLINEEEQRSKKVHAMKKKRQAAHKLLNEFGIADTAMD